MTYYMTDDNQNQYYKSELKTAYLYHYCKITKAHNDRILLMQK